MSEEAPLASLYVELADLFERARRAIDESRDLTADRDFILWWYGMRARPQKPPIDMLAD
jgi:hypothetical protein